MKETAALKIVELRADGSYLAIYNADLPVEYQELLELREGDIITDDPFNRVRRIAR